MASFSNLFLPHLSAVQKNLAPSGIQTRISEVEGKGNDHQTTRPPPRPMSVYLCIANFGMESYRWVHDGHSSYRGCSVASLETYDLSSNPAS